MWPVGRVLLEQRDEPHLVVGRRLLERRQRRVRHQQAVGRHELSEGLAHEVGVRFLLCLEAVPLVDHEDAHAIPVDALARRELRVRVERPLAADAAVRAGETHHKRAGRSAFLEFADVLLDVVARALDEPALVGRDDALEVHRAGPWV